MYLKNPTDINLRMEQAEAPKDKGLEFLILMGPNSLSDGSIERDKRLCMIWNRSHNHIYIRNIVYLLEYIYI